MTENIRTSSGIVHEPRGHHLVTRCGVEFAGRLDPPKEKDRWERTFDPVTCLFCLRTRR